MVSGWRRVFCTSLPKEELEQENKALNDGRIATSPQVNSRFGFFSPRFHLHSEASSSPNLRCRTSAAEAQTPSSSSAPATPPSYRLSPSPRSPISLFKSTFHISRTKCGTCGGVFKTGEETATFPAECPRNRSDLATCPACGSSLKFSRDERRGDDANRKHFRVYDDDEPLSSSSPGAHFIPIPEEHDDEEAVEEGRFAGMGSKSAKCENGTTAPEIAILPQSAVISGGRNNETRAVVLKVRAPHHVESSLHHTPLDLVALLDLTGTCSSLVSRIKFAMGILISSLGPGDRLSIVAFWSGSKRLLPLRRMTNSGRRSARRVVDMVGPSGDGMCVRDALKKAAKVLTDRRERNPEASIVVLSPAHANTCEVTTTTHLSDPHLRIPIHWLSLGEPNSHALSKCLSTILSLSLHDVVLHLRLSSGDITAVYPLKDRPFVHTADSVRLGNMHGGEERELLAEIKVPRSTCGEIHVLRVRASYKQCPMENALSDYQSFTLPHPESARSVVPGIQRLRNIHVATKATAESRRLVEFGGDVLGGYHVLSCAISLIMQSEDESAGYCLRNLEGEMAELQRRWGQQDCGVISRREGEDKQDKSTPTSSWRSAEKLAKVASMRKHFKRVSDLHGFENARF